MWHPSLMATANKLRVHAETLRQLFTKHLTGGWDIIRATFNSSKDLMTIELALTECMRDISCIGCLLETANVMNDDNYGKVSFDESKPRTYRKGWNMLHSKTGKWKRSYKWQDSVPLDQTRNPSIPDDPVHALASANMSGKTWYLLQDLYLQACAQAFGYAPGLEVNIPRHEQLVFIDRASTDHDRNLSAFGSEIDWWKRALDASGKGPARIWSDEPFSTTGDIDQATLAVAVSDEIAQQGNHMVLATHNERLLDRLENTRGECVSHFRTEIGEKDLVFTHKLESGRDDSRALEVAEKFLDSRIIQYAKASMAGTPLKVTPQPDTDERVILPYSDEARETLVGEPRGFSQFFPDQLDVEVHRSRRERGLTRIVRPQERPISAPQCIVHIESRDNDLHYHLRIPGTQHSQMGMAQSFLRSGVTNNVSELMERQRMWSELETSEKRSAIDAAITTTWANLGSATCAHPELLMGFNEQLRDGALDLMRDAHMSGMGRVHPGTLAAFEKILYALNAVEGWGDSFLEPILQPLRRFCALALEWHKLSCGIYDEGPNGPKGLRMRDIRKETAALVGAPEDENL